MTLTNVEQFQFEILSHGFEIKCIGGELNHLIKWGYFDSKYDFTFFYYGLKFIGKKRGNFFETKEGKIFKSPQSVLVL